jgi:hypothetical protein
MKNRSEENCINIYLYFVYINSALICVLTIRPIGIKVFDVQFDQSETYEAYDDENIDEGFCFWSHDKVIN